MLEVIFVAFVEADILKTLQASLILSLNKIFD